MAVYHLNVLSSSFYEEEDERGGYSRIFHERINQNLRRAIQFTPRLKNPS